MLERGYAIFLPNPRGSFGPSSLAIYAGEGHGLRDPANLADAERRTLEWFDKYLR